MALRSSGPGRPDATKDIVGSDNSSVAQESGTGRLESVMIGANGSAVAQDSSGNLEALMKGSRNSAIAQDSNNRLESIMLGGNNSAIAQNVAGQMEAVIIGSQSAILNQESGTGKQVIRRGGAEADADIDVGLKNSGIDVASATFSSGNKNAGGAEALAGKISSFDANSAFNVQIDWLNDNDNTTITTFPTSFQSATDLEFNMIMRSDRFNVQISATGDTSTNINGSINAH